MDFKFWTRSLILIATTGQHRSIFARKKKNIYIVHLSCCSAWEIKITLASINCGGRDRTLERHPKIDHGSWLKTSKKADKSMFLCVGGYLRINPYSKYANDWESSKRFDEFAVFISLSILVIVGSSLLFLMKGPNAKWSGPRLNLIKR